VWDLFRRGNNIRSGRQNPVEQNSVEQNDNRACYGPFYGGATQLRKERWMLLIALFLVLALLFFGLGFTLHFLWVIAAIIFVFWLAGFAFRAGSGRGRWYYW
jgi:hypothetical protein